MRAVGLITEYNPFHNGHLYHIEEAKKITGADLVIVIMSGDFVQRGTPAVMDKYLRASAALSCGADLVFELPCCYATGSAEFFAEGAVRALASLNIVDCICFGSECGDIKKLEAIADILISEPEAYSICLQDKLKSGLNYAKARAEAFRLIFPEYADVLNTPNNILGIEYIKAIKKCNSHMTPYTIKRAGHAYHDTNANHPFASATAIRKLFNDASNDYRLYIPKSALNLYTLNKAVTFPINEDDFSSALYYKLYNSLVNCVSLSDYFEVNTELANRIIKLLPQFKSFSDFAMLLKNKSYTHSRICRGLLHLLLDIKAEDLSLYIENGWIFYNRLLGMRNSSVTSDTLSNVAKSSKLPLLTTIKNAADSDNLSYLAKRMLKTDMLASDLYEHVSSIKYTRNPIPEATRKFLKY